MQMTPETTWQMKVLALNDTTNVICTVATACAPACDSSIRFYTTDWKPLTDHSFITLPVMSDFLITPDSASIYEFDEASRSADILLMKVDMNKENTELAVTLSTPDYMSKETADILNKAKEENRCIVAVGTTTTRTLETIMSKYNTFKECSGWTDIFIYPGYEFKGIDSLITNFHLPKSTLIMLVSALAGKENIMNAYKHAVEEKYRFFSFGDAMFIKKNK